MNNNALKLLIKETVSEAFVQLEKIDLAGNTQVKDYVHQVADAYEAAPSMEPRAVPHWNALIQHTEGVLFPKIEAQVKKIYREKNPEFKTNPDGGGIQFVNYHPYANAKEMTQEVMGKGIFRVSTADASHPLWSVEQNSKFRAVHDWYTHIINKSDFSPRGEIKAYNTHVKLLPPAAVPAAFTEIVGQASFTIARGHFGEQKICLLPQFDYYVVGKVNKSPEPTADQPEHPHLAT